MTRDEVLDALHALGRHVAAANRVIDLAVYGGSSLMLVSNIRLSSGDVDAVAQTDHPYVDDMARLVANELDRPESWLNDGVRTYLSPAGEHPDHHVFLRSCPSEAQPGIRIYVPTAEYGLALKLMAMRIGPDDSKDLDDILNLCRVTGITDEHAMLDLAAMFYPDARISGKLKLSVGHMSRLASRLTHETTPH